MTWPDSEIRPESRATSPTVTQVGLGGDVTGPEPALAVANLNFGMPLFNFLVPSWQVQLAANELVTLSRGGPGSRSHPRLVAACP